jgi:hypothetical protein
MPYEVPEPRAERQARLAQEAAHAAMTQMPLPRDGAQDMNRAVASGE